MNNLTQIVSVLLEAFTPPTRGLYDPLLPLSPQMKPTSNNYLPPPPLTGLSPYHLNDRDRGEKTNGGDSLEEEVAYNQRMEAMHIASKGLLILIKVLGKNHLKVLFFSRLQSSLGPRPSWNSLFVDSVKQ